jgi:CubicO group peptidase (beta-lactamase class C family)
MFLKLFAAAALIATFPQGLWYYHVSYPTGDPGTLTVWRSGARWNARFGNTTASAPARGGEITLRFRDGDAFRGATWDGALHGFWVRRPVVQDPAFPTGEALGHAGRLTMTPDGPHRWRAQVQPLEDTFTLYLNLFTDSDGTFKAAFRNPELHSHGSAMQFNVVQTGDVLQFANPQNTSQPPDPPLATIFHSPERIHVVWNDLKKAIDLVPAPPQAAAAFIPRIEATPYAYRPPANIEDGWPIARAGSAGMNEAALAAMVQRIIDRDPAGARAWLIHSVSIAYRGKLVLDEYFYGHNALQWHDTRSASKTFSSVILGALMKEGSRLSPQSKVYDVMAARGPFLNPDPRKANITLGHLLTHTAGYACDDNAENSPGGEDAMEADRSNPDWTKRTLDLPLQYDPGSHYAYCSMNINLAGAMLSQATGQWLPLLFDRTVAQPLDFGPYAWNLQGTGEGYLGGGVFVRPRDFLKIGQTYLDGGVWNGRRIVTSDWVKDSLSAHAHISPATTGRSGDALIMNYYDVDEGWAWHMIDVKSGDQTYHAFHANGNGGQLLIILPELDLAVMFTAGNYNQGLWNRERDDIVGGMIIPAIAHSAYRR